MEICIKWKMCRVCLFEEPKNVQGTAACSNNQLRHLFDEDKKLVLYIYELFGVFMKPDDSLPDKICSKCIAIINNSVKLRKTCRSSNNYLRYLLERTISASSLFKQVNSKCQISDDEAENEEMKIESVQIELGSTDFQNQKNIPKEKGLKNTKNIESLEHQEKDIGQEFADDASGTSVEVEDIIEVSEEMFTQAVYPDAGEEVQNIQVKKEEKNQVSDKHVNPEISSQLQKLYMDTNFGRMKNTIDVYNGEHEDTNNSNNTDCDALENEEIDTQDLEENKELYEIFRGIENKACNANDSNRMIERHEEQRLETSKNLEYVNDEKSENADDVMDESFVLDLEDKSNDNENQAQVSSTVETNDEIEYYEHNSNETNLDEKCLAEQDSNNCSSNKSSSQETSEKHPHNTRVDRKSLNSAAGKNKKTTTVSFPRRRAKAFPMKSSTTGDVKFAVCKLCGNKFTNRNLMNIHMKVHYNEKNHQCELCSKSFITACNLQAHMRIHTGEKPFECKYCYRRFNDRSSHVRHERTHTNEKPFRCGSCDKSFSLATTLQNHQKVHTNERLYRCEPCGKSFKLSHHLKTHQKTALHRSTVKVEQE